MIPRGGLAEKESLSILGGLGNMARGRAAYRVLGVRVGAVQILDVVAPCDTMSQELGAKVGVPGDKMSLQKPLLSRPHPAHNNFPLIPTRLRRLIFPGFCLLPVDTVCYRYSFTLLSK